MANVVLHVRVQMAVWYLTWGVLAYVMTLGKSSQQARDWVFTGQIVMLAAEMAIVTTPGGGGVLPSWLFPRMAEYEVSFFFFSRVSRSRRSCMPFLRTKSRNKLAQAPKVR